MRSILIHVLFFVLTFSVYGCFGSRERGDEVDFGFDAANVTIEIGGTGGRDNSRAVSGGIDGGHAGVGGGVFRPFDAAIIDAVVVQADSNGFGGTGGIGGTDIDDDAGMSDAPCAPNCPYLVWVEIAGGIFQMGSPEGVGDDNEHPRHEVTVQSFRILKTEVTVSQYGKCVDEGVCSAPTAGFDTDNWGKSDRQNHPINSVTWSEAREFAEWLDGRLPSEAEWEYAARSGGQDIIFPWGNEEVTCERAVIGRDASGNSCGNDRSMEVCSKSLGNTSQGLCDMVGNVWEWLEDDWHDSYTGGPLNGQAWIDNPRSHLRVLRGGSRGDDPDDCRSASRLYFPPDVVRIVSYGFRVVRDL